MQYFCRLCYLQNMCTLNLKYYPSQNINENKFSMHQKLFLVEMKNAICKVKVKFSGFKAHEVKVRARSFKFPLSSNTLKKQRKILMIVQQISKQKDLERISSVIIWFQNIFSADTSQNWLSCYRVFHVFLVHRYILNVFTFVILQVA